MTTYKEFAVTGQVAWAKVHAPVNKYQSTEQQYEILVELNDKQIEAIYKLEDSQNRKVRTVDGLEGNFLKFSRPVLSKAGKEMPAPKVFDDEGNQTEALLGNGSVCKVTFTRIPTSRGNEIVRFNRINVVELVTYEKNEVQGDVPGLDDIEVIATDKGNDDLLSDVF